MANGLAKLLTAALSYLGGACVAPNHQDSIPYTVQDSETHDGVELIVTSHDPALAASVDFLVAAGNMEVRLPHGYDGPVDVAVDGQHPDYPTTSDSRETIIIMPYEPGKVEIDLRLDSKLSPEGYRLKKTEETPGGGITVISKHPALNPDFRSIHYKGLGQLELQIAGGFDGPVDYSVFHGKNDITSRVSRLPDGRGLNLQMPYENGRVRVILNSPVYK